MNFNGAFEVSKISGIKPKRTSDELSIIIYVDSSREALFRIFL